MELYCSNIVTMTSESKHTFFSFSGFSKKEQVSFLMLADFSLSSPLLDAWVSYHINPNLNLSFGQKLIKGNNREMSYVEDNLQFAERSILSKLFSNTGREFGLFLDLNYSFNNFNINIKKTDRKKTVSFQVERGLVKVLVPRHLDKTKLNNIIKSKSKWIKSKLSKVDEILPSRKKDYVSGEDFMYLGKHYKLKVIKGQKYDVKLSDKYLTLTIKSHTKDDKIKRILKT